MIVSTDSPSQVMHLICTGDPIFLRSVQDTEEPPADLDGDRTVVFSSDEALRVALSVIEEAQQPRLDVRQFPRGLRVQLAVVQSEIPRGRRSGRASAGPTPYPARAAGGWSGRPLLTTLPEITPLAIPDAWIGRPVFLELPALTPEYLGQVLSLTTLEGFEKTAVLVIVADEDVLPVAIADNLRAAGVEFWETGEEYFEAEPSERLAILESALSSQASARSSTDDDSVPRSARPSRIGQSDWKQEKDYLLRVIRGE